MNMRWNSKREAVACDVESLVFTVCLHDKRGEVDRCKLPYIPQEAINCMLVTHAKYKYPAMVLAITFLSHVQKAKTNIMCNVQPPD